MTDTMSEHKHSYEIKYFPGTETCDDGGRLELMLTKSVDVMVRAPRPCVAVAEIRSALLVERRPLFPTCRVAIFALPTSSRQPTASKSLELVPGRVCSSFSTTPHSFRHILYLCPSPAAHGLYLVHRPAGLYSNVSSRCVSYPIYSHNAE